MNNREWKARKLIILSCVYMAAAECLKAKTPRSRLQRSIVRRAMEYGKGSKVTSAEVYSALRWTLNKIVGLPEDRQQ
jgi:hypothetical protein